jgi:hypothetical protein
MFTGDNMEIQINKARRSALLKQFRSRGFVEGTEISPGVKVIIKHYRFDEEGKLRRYKRSGPDNEDGTPFKPTFSPATKGGQTVCLIVLDNDKPGEFGPTLARGVAVCHGLKSHEEAVDPYNYKIGAHIAFGRALEKLVPDGS